MSRAKKVRFGGLPPKYHLVLNPYPDQRLTSCPFCRGRTGQRKLPLLIHVDPLNLIALNYTCRYCRRCDLLLAHKHEIEHLLHDLFSRTAPEVIGNEYLIIGTVEKSAWREGMREPTSVPEMLSHVHDFVEYYQELRMNQPGWYPDGMEPPTREPPKSEEWVKAQ